MLVSDLYAMIDSLAPFETQEAFDNSGLLLGSARSEVTGIHAALDLTERVIDEAEAAGANLIVTHHPILFHGCKRIVEEDYESRLIARMLRLHMNLIAAHTNLDRAEGGINDALAARCGLTDVTARDFLRVGSLVPPCPAGELVRRLSEALHTTIRVMGQFPEDRLIRRMGLVGGADSEDWEQALALGADAYLTGEVKHHHALAAADAGLLILEGGHFATEEPGIFALADTLQKRLDTIQCNLRVTKSSSGGYAPPSRLESEGALSSWK